MGGFNVPSLSCSAGSEFECAPFVALVEVRAALCIQQVKTELRAEQWQPRLRLLSSCEQHDLARRPCESPRTSRSVRQRLVVRLPKALSTARDERRHAPWRPVLPARCSRAFAEGGTPTIITKSRPWRSRPRALLGAATRSRVSSGSNPASSLPLGGCKEGSLVAADAARGALRCSASSRTTS